MEGGRGAGGRGEGRDQEGNRDLRLGVPVGLRIIATHAKLSATMARRMATDGLEVICQANIATAASTRLTNSRRPATLDPFLKAIPAISQQ